MKKSKPTEWIVSRSTARDGQWHIQARTRDQLSSFALVVPKTTPIYQAKGVGGIDVFTVTLGSGQATMNIVGKIKYDFKD